MFKGFQYHYESLLQEGLDEHDGYLLELNESQALPAGFPLLYAV